MDEPVRTLTERLPALSRRGLFGLGAGAVGGLLVGCSGGDPTADPSASGSSADTAEPSPRASSATPSETPSASPSGPVEPDVAGTVAENLDVPWGLVFLPGGDALLSERDTAKIKRVSPDGDVETLGTVSGVQAASGTGEGGLLGLALDPDDPDVLFAYLTSSEDNRVVRLDISDGVGKPDPILTGIPSSTHHNGGRLVFGPDGHLYVSTGEAERPGIAQDRDSLGGKILRITTSGKAVDGNPFDNRVFSYGHRNPQGLAFDADGRLWASEFGDKAVDELNLIEAGNNYGWPSAEGDSRSKAFTNPAVSWSPTSTSSPSGLAIVRGTAFIAALQGQCLFSSALDGTKAAKPKTWFAEDYGRLRTVVAAPDGSLWLTTSNTDGRQSPGRDDDRILRVTL